MRARYWLLLFYVLLGLPLSLWTGDWAWLGWALPIAWVMMFALFLTGHSREFTFRRCRRQMSELADRIGARDGQVVREAMQRFGVLEQEPQLRVTTMRQGAETDVLEALLTNAAEAGYTPIAYKNLDYLDSDTERFLLTIRVRAADTHPWHPVEAPDGHVFAEVHIQERRGLSRPPRQLPGDTEGRRSTAELD